MSVLPAPRVRVRIEQPLDASRYPDAHLRLATVLALTGLSKSTIYAMLAQREFPEPLRFGQRCTRWRASDVQTWLRNRI